MTDHSDTMVAIEGIKKDIQKHVNESEETHDRLFKHDEEVSNALQYIADELFGPPTPTIDGEVVRHGGRLDQLEAQLEAKQAKLPWFSIIGVTSVVATAFGSLVAVFV